MPDTSRAVIEFGFKAMTRFEEGLEKTIELYLSNNYTKAEIETK